MTPEEVTTEAKADPIRACPWARMGCYPAATQAMRTATGTVITMAGSINAVATTMGAGLTPTAITMAGNTTTVETIDTTEAVGTSRTHHPTAADTTDVRSVERSPFPSWGPTLET